LAVVTTLSGGLPVVDVTATTPKLGLPVTEAVRGIAVTKVVSKPGLPVTFETAATSAEVAQFLTRTSGLDATHTNAYTALINGLVADGIWAKLDVLHVYATQNQTTALLNLVSTSYNGLALGATLPTFTADRGFLGGVDAAFSGYIDPVFNPATAVSPKHVRDSAHISAWSLTNLNSIIEVAGAVIASTWLTGILTRFTDNSAYFYVNTTLNTGAAVANSIGHYIANRSSSSSVEGYKNGASLVINASNPSIAPANLAMFACAYNLSGTGVKTSGNQLAMMSIGASLNTTDATNFYNRLRTYMTTVGVP
jgi:antitoxin component of RelBE/YafQ-DinJ toxin-antitoxin module